MKINKITNRLNSGSYSKKANKKAVTQNPIQTKSEVRSGVIPSYYGKDLISFGAKDFKDTLKENYFKLPENCSPDKFQVDAGKSIHEGKNVIVEAPTGTGKTAVANYALSDNLEKGKKTYYTGPLKALNNQKLEEFKDAYDAEIGILTGDRRENIDAPIIVMTTEVYRNMALSHMYGEQTPISDDLGTVIYDEFHYLGDPSRGNVWEESVMFTPEGVKMIPLSATARNAKEIRDWMSEFGETELISVPEEARHVPLHFDKIKTESYLRERKRIGKGENNKAVIESEIKKISKPALSDFKYAIEKLNKEDKLPAILFVFSKNFSTELLEYLADTGEDLTTNKEKEEIEKIVNKHASKEYVGSNLDIYALKKGYAIHNAGIIPPQKKLIEELFQKKLIKAVIATETLAAGINMPAKTVVISSPYKPSDAKDSPNKVRKLSANEFKQMSGRAGRRGIDEVGYVYTMPVDMKTQDVFEELESAPCDEIKSRYSPDYAFLAGYFGYNDDTEKLREIYGKSFYAHSSEGGVSKEKVEELMKLSERKIQVLKERGFLEEKDGKIELTPMGYMASKVRGYDALSLTETIASGVFKEMSPEALAMFAAAAANPAQNGEQEITRYTDWDKYFGNPIEDTDRIYSKMKKDINIELKKLGKDIDDFESYDELLSFISGLKISETKTDELKTRLSITGTLLAQYEKITSEKTKYTEDELISAIKREQTVPSKVSEKYLQAVETYKNRNNFNSISEKIERLKFEFASIKEGKGKKTKAANDKKRNAISNEIKYAQKMLFLDKHLPEVMEKNRIFLKEHNVKELKSDYERMRSELAKIQLKQVLTDKVNGLKSIEAYKNEYDMKLINLQNYESVQKAADEMFENSSKVYSSQLKYQTGDMPVELGGEYPEKVYKWAMLNKINTDTLSNWIYTIKSSGFSGPDEGSVYRSVMQTADLLSQINEIANAGKEVAKDFEEGRYYSELAYNARNARRLIIQEPVKM